MPPGARRVTSARLTASFIRVKPMPPGPNTTFAKQQEATARITCCRFSKRTRLAKQGMQKARAGRAVSSPTPACQHRRVETAAAGRETKPVCWATGTEARHEILAESSVCRLKQKRVSNSPLRPKSPPLHRQKTSPADRKCVYRNLCLPHTPHPFHIFSLALPFPRPIRPRRSRRSPEPPGLRECTPEPKETERPPSCRQVRLAAACCDSSCCFFLASSPRLLPRRSVFDRIASHRIATKRSPVGPVTMGYHCRGGSVTTSRWGQVNVDVNGLPNEEAVE